MDALNLGCGRHYRTGYINVDAHDRTAADLIANALRLPFSSRSLSRVRADHLMEHFSWGEIPYFIAECFRVLRPGGQLVLETPDPDESCRRFLNAQARDEREACLAWILGRPSPGYHHRWLYDRIELKRVLAEAGFEEICFSEPETHRYAPGLHVTALRSDSPVHAMIAELRQYVPEISRACPDETREIEQRFFGNVGAATQCRGSAFLQRFRENALLSTELSAHWVTLASLHGVWSHEDAKPLLTFLRALQRIGLHESLQEAFVRLCERTNAVSDGYDFLFDAADRVLAGCLAADRQVTRSELAKALELPREPVAGTTSPGRDPDTGPGNPLFTRASLERVVVQWRDRGVRLLAKRQLEEADALLSRAFNAKLRYFYTVWNLGVLRTLQGDIATATAYYRAALRFEQPGTDDTLRCALSLCLLASGDLEAAGAEIEQLPAGSVREELAGCHARLEAGDPAPVPPPPVEAVPAGRGIWW